MVIKIPTTCSLVKKALNYFKVLKYCFNGGITFLAETLSFIHFIKSLPQIEHLLSVTYSL